MKRFSYSEFYENAQTAYNSGDFAKLRGILTEWQSVALTELGGIGYALAVHMNHNYLGLMHFAEGDITGAKSELLKAGKAPSSIVLSITGPNMLLAKKILELGDREVVFQYLKYCRGFWSLPFRWYYVPSWKKEIAQGRVPDFSRFV